MISRLTIRLKGRWSCESPKFSYWVDLWSLESFGVKGVWNCKIRMKKWNGNRKWRHGGKRHYLYKASWGKSKSHFFKIAHHVSAPKTTIWVEMNQWSRSTLSSHDQWVGLAIIRLDHWCSHMAVVRVDVISHHCLGTRKRGNVSWLKIDKRMTNHHVSTCHIRLTTKTLHLVAK